MRDAPKKYNISIRSEFNLLQRSVQRLRAPKRLDLSLPASAPTQSQNLILRIRDLRLP